MGEMTTRFSQKVPRSHEVAESEQRITAVGGEKICITGEFEIWSELVKGRRAREERQWD